MSKLQAAVVASLCICLSVTALADRAGGLTISAAPGELIATGGEGCVRWKVRLPGAGAPGWTRSAGGVVVLDSGLVVDRFGRAVARMRDSKGEFGGRDGGLRGDCPYWSELARLTPAPGSGQSYQHNRPLFDGAGNAWVVVTRVDSGDYALQVRRSNGHDGTWLPVETISDTTRYVSGPEGVIDADDNVTIVFRDISGGYKLYAMRYEPGAGWSGPSLAYSTGSFFQAIEAASDSAGNVVAVFDPSDAVWSIVYDAASGTWGSAGQVSPAGYRTMLPTVVQNRAGDGVYLLYMVRGGGPPGIYAHRFDSGAQAWGPAEFLPGTESIGFSSAGPASRYPAAVDVFGEATVFWQSTPPYGVYASRTSGGIWQPAHELLAPGSDDADMENFAHAASSAFGDAFGVITRYESGSIRLYAFRYRVGVGWDEPDNPYTFVFNITTRSRIGPYRGAHAVATMFGRQNGVMQLISLLYNGSRWLPELVDIPEQYASFFQEIEPDRGEPLLVLEAEELVGANYGIWATWLRNLPGDLNGDGVVDLSDLASLLAAYELSAGGDVDGDGDTDLADLAALLANYGEPCP